MPAVWTAVCAQNRYIQRWLAVAMTEGEASFLEDESHLTATWEGPTAGVLLMRSSSACIPEQSRAAAAASECSHTKLARHTQLQRQ